MPTTSPTTTTAVDTGQNDNINTVNNINIDDNAKEPTNLAENQSINPYDPVSEEGVLGLLVEMEYERDKNVFDEKLKAMTLYHIYTLVSKWIENEMIEGVYVVGENHLEEDLENYLSWAYLPRVKHRKDKSIVECAFQAKTTATAFQLFQDQQSLCQELHMKISTKKTDMNQYVQRIGFLTGPYVRLASSDKYVREINNKALVHRGCIEIKKQITHEKGTASKALVIYIVCDESKEIDEKICDATFKRFKYISYKLSDSAQRLGAMHSNEMTNIKSRFETLYNVKLNDTVYQGIERITLEDILLKEKYGIHNLFLAIEQGSGKFSNHINVVLNPPVKDQARRWLVSEYPLLTFLNAQASGTSVIAPSNEKKEKYDKDLKNFLTPKLINIEATRTKKFGNKLKTYAEVLGIEI